MLPGTLALEDLHGDHASVPNNPLLAESLHLTGYVEKVGSGTQRMIELCAEAGLPEPDFEERAGFFVLTLWRDRLTADAAAGFDLNDRQREALACRPGDASTRRSSESSCPSYSAARRAAVSGRR